MKGYRVVCLETGLIVGVRWTYREARDQIMIPYMVSHGHVFHYATYPNN